MSDGHEGQLLKSTGAIPGEEVRARNPAMEKLFPDFRESVIETPQARISTLIGGAGSPVLLLHGYPETKAAWHRIAGSLSEDFSVIVPDLPGYGDSEVAGDNLEAGSKRWMGSQLHALMESLGYSRYAVVGHDRGARVAYRMALDKPDVVTSLTSLAVVPTCDMWSGADKNFGMGAFHWFMLAQPFDLPERLLSSDPDYFLDYTLSRMAENLNDLDPVALNEYRRCFRKPEVRHAMCEDYRAAASVDEAYDLQDRVDGRRIECPVLALWPEGRTFGGGRVPIDIWKDWAADVTGKPLKGGHLLPERAAESVLSELRTFLGATQ
ncbi:MAG: alpha/beta fold hydrolase [Phyllobacterium sp.]